MSEITVLTHVYTVYFKFCTQSHACINKLYWQNSGVTILYSLQDVSIVADYNIIRVS